MAHHSVAFRWIRAGAAFAFLTLASGCATAPASAVTATTRTNADTAWQQGVLERFERERTSPLVTGAEFVAVPVRAGPSEIALVVATPVGASVLNSSSRDDKGRWRLHALVQSIRAGHADRVFRVHCDGRVVPCTSRVDRNHFPTSGHVTAYPSSLEITVCGTTFYAVAMRTVGIEEGCSVEVAEGW